MMTATSTIAAGARPSSTSRFVRAPGRWPLVRVGCFLEAVDGAVVVAVMRS